MHGKKKSICVFVFHLNKGYNDIYIALTTQTKTTCSASMVALIRNLQKRYWIHSGVNVHDKRPQQNDSTIVCL